MLHTAAEGGTATEGDRGGEGRLGRVTWGLEFFFGESGLLENEPTVPAEQAHTTRRQ